YSSYSGINSGLGVLYLAMVFLEFASFIGILPVAAEGRTVFYRERAAQTYNAFWYFFASSVMEIPYAIVAALLFLAVFFPMVGFTGAEPFFIIFLALMLTVLLHTYMGEFLVFLAPNVEVAELIGMLLDLIFSLLMGFSPPASALPSGAKWIYHINPLAYTFAVISTVVFGNCTGDGASDIGCKQMTNVPPTLPDGITVKEYLDIKFLMEYNEIWRNIAILIAFVALFGSLRLLVMRFVNHQKK
ncbi:hypothetical protein BBP00_00009276, partial [Phytophthora kernoviae]